MSSDIMAAQMSTKGITFSRAQTGWIFREDKRVSIYFRNHISTDNRLKIIYISVLTQNSFNYNIYTQNWLKNGII